MSCCNANLEKPCCQFGMEVNEKDLLLNVSKALSNEVRLQILEFMSMNPGCITGNLVDYLPLAQSTISQHLKVLKEAKIIRGQIEGPSTRYCINDDTIKQYKDLITKIV